MVRQCSTRCQTRRWPSGVFYNTLDLALLNASVIFKEVNDIATTRRQFQMRLTEQLCGFEMNENALMNVPEVQPLAVQYCNV